MESILVNVIAYIAWLLALPLRTVTWLVITIRTRLYDPEKDVCPSCGFRGDRGTGGKSCIIKFVRTQGVEKAAIEHTCLRDGAKYYTKILTPAEKWLPPLDENKIQQAAKRTEL